MRVTEARHSRGDYCARMAHEQTSAAGRSALPLDGRELDSVRVFNFPDSAGCFAQAAPTGSSEASERLVPALFLRYST